MAAKKSRSIPTDQFLRDYPPAIQDLANELRAFVKATLPDAQEAVRFGWRLIGYTVPFGKKQVYVGFIGPFENRVALGFEWGALMDDPTNILEGDGKQVKFITVKYVQPEKFTPLLQEAVRVACLPRAEKMLLKMAKTKPTSIE